MKKNLVNFSPLLLLPNSRPFGEINPYPVLDVVHFARYALYVKVCCGHGRDETRGSRQLRQEYPLTKGSGDR